MAFVRVAIVVANTFIYSFLLPWQGTHPALAFGIIGLSFLYSAFVLVAEPYRRFPLLLTSAFTSLSDSSFILVWIAATGGYASPFHTLLYVSVLAIAFRYSSRETLLAIGLYVAGYAGLLGFLGALGAHVGEVSVRCIYIVFIGISGNLMSRELLVQTTAQARATNLVSVLQKLRERDEQLQDAQQIARLGTWIWDQATDSCLLSPACLRLVGLSDAATPTTQQLLELIHADDRDLVLDRLREAIRRREPLQIELRLQLPGGEVRSFSARARVQEQELGKPIRLLGTIQDISDRKELEARLTMSERLVALGTLAAGVAHEVNNPLSYICANLSFVQTELGKNAESVIPPRTQQEMQQALMEALDGAERVRRVVRDLKSFARAGESDRGAVDLNRILELAAHMAANEIRHRARLVRALGDVPPVDGNEWKLGQVFLNLLVNACQAIPEGSAHENSIELRTYAASSGRVVAEVRDTGAGIPAEIRKRIFDPFFTTKPIGVGTGLGLSICHGIVSSYGGEIEVESEPGKGTVFRVYLQRSSEPLDPVRPAQLERLSEPRRRILIVDDDPPVADATGRMLRSEHDVEIVYRATAALERIRAGSEFDLILCDVMMPEMGGSDFYGALQQLAPKQAARVVFLTGGAFTERAQSLLEQNPNRWLEKPLDPLKLRKLWTELAGPTQRP